MGNGFSGVKSQVTPLEEFYAVVLRAKPYFSADNLIRLTGTKIIDAIFNVCETVERTTELDLETILCRQELHHLEEESRGEVEIKPRRESASQIDEFFETPRSSSYPSGRTMHGTNEDDIFLRPSGLWEDITSSIQKLDPDNADMLSALAAAGHIKMEVPDECNRTSAAFSNNSTSTHNNDYIIPNIIPKIEMSNSPPHQVPPTTSLHLMTTPVTQYNGNVYQHSYHSPNYQLPTNRLIYAPPPTPPTSEPGSPGNTLQGPARRTPPPPYPAADPSQCAKTSTMPMILKFNRRNNPELEKRRVHHCDFPGKSTVLRILTRHT
ncbi:hypothetical protein RUM44_009816 [Polyplax serrata]|uniref:Uncharacterized protein n=1 Tax=Polyplax serrata TaxID=468196 RepID=A0ABR1ATS4_POLSC